MIMQSANTSAAFASPLLKKRIISEYSKVFNMGQIEKITTDILILSLKGTNEVL